MGEHVDSPENRGIVETRLRFGRATFDHRATGQWIAALLTLLLVLNLCGAFLYSKAHPAENGWESVWNYLESDTAKLVSASLIFPLLIFVVEGRFNLLETIRAARSERRKRAQDERREARAQAIEQTTKFWSRITGWVGDVAFWDGKSNLDDLAKESWNLSVAGADTINAWASFRNTVKWDGSGSATELEDHFLRLVNALISSADSTIFYLRSVSHTERDALQSALLLIAVAIERWVQHPVRNVLYASLELLDISESDDPEELRFISSEEEARNRRDELEKRIDENMAWIAGGSTLVKSLCDGSAVMATASGAEADALRSAGLAEGDEVLRERYFAIPQSERFRAERVEFTRSWLNGFADELSFQLFLQDVAERRSASETGV